MKRMLIGFTIMLLLSLNSVALAQEQVTASAELMDTQGNVVGIATLTQGSSGVIMIVSVVGLSDVTAGEHGIHIHEVGNCEPDFSAAGEHFNPQGTQHGLDNPAGPHAGDNPNMIIDADGTGTYNVVNDRITLSAGPNSVFDEDGSAIVIHAGPDDQSTDPSGNSGDRIVCGVIQQPGAAGAAMADDADMADDTDMPDAAAMAGVDAADEADMAEDTDMADADVVEETEMTEDADIAENAEIAPGVLPTAGGSYSYSAWLVLAAGLLLLLGGAGLRYKMQ